MILPEASCCAPLLPNACPGGVVPGPQGDQGPSGTSGVGINAFTATTGLGFTVPAIGDPVTISVGETGWMAQGQVVFIQSAGYYTVSSINDETDFVGINLGYDGNATEGTAISSEQAIAPGGLQGVDGDMGGGVTSVGLSAPSIFTVTGSPITSTGTLALTFAGGQAANRVLASPDATTGAITLRPLVAGDIPSIPASKITTGQIPIAQGGTGQSTQSAGFNALAPTTATGDIIIRSSTGNTRLPVGTNGQLLTANSAVTGGIDWENAPSALVAPASQAAATPYTMLSTDRIVGVSVATASNVLLLAAPSNGRLVTVKDRSGSGGTNNITVSAGAGDTIEGAATKVITTNYGFLDMYYDAVDLKWYVIGAA